MAPALSRDFLQRKAGPYTTCVGADSANVIKRYPGAAAAVSDRSYLAPALNDPANGFYIFVVSARLAYELFRAKGESTPRIVIIPGRTEYHNGRIMRLV